MFIIVAAVANEHNEQNWVRVNEQATNGKCKTYIDNPQKEVWTLWAQVTLTYSWKISTTPHSYRSPEVKHLCITHSHHSVHPRIQLLHFNLQCFKEIIKHPTPYSSSPAASGWKQHTRREGGWKAQYSPSRTMARKKQEVFWMKEI